MTIHNLKTWPEYFKKAMSGEKTFEIRKNDRNYQVGDILILQEWDPVTREYTGNEQAVRVLYISNFDQKPGNVVMAIEFR